MINYQDCSHDNEILELFEPYVWKGNECLDCNVYTSIDPAQILPLVSRVDEDRAKCSRELVLI